MNERVERHDFWQLVAKAELKLQREIEAEFRRHETAMRILLLKTRMTLKRQKKLEK